MCEQICCKYSYKPKKAFTAEGECLSFCALSLNQCCSNAKTACYGGIIFPTADCFLYFIISRYLILFVLSFFARFCWLACYFKGSVSTRCTRNCISAVVSLAVMSPSPSQSMEIFCASEIATLPFTALLRRTASASVTFPSRSTSPIKGSSKKLT